MASDKSSHKGLKICFGVTALLLLIVLVVLVVLFLTILKPKDPKITTQPVTLKSIDWIVFPVFRLTVSLGIAVTVDNHNYGSFKYKNSTAYVSYRGTVVASAPIEQDTIPARGKHNITTTLDIIADKLVQNATFKSDFSSGILNFTSLTTLHGKVSLFKILKVKATSYSHCDISVFVLAQTANSVCNSDTKFGS